MPRSDGSSFAKPADRASTTRQRRRRGFALIELAIAISILMIGLVSVISASSRMHGLGHQNRERSLAQNALRSMSERIHARSQALSADPDTWAQGLVAIYGPGGTFGDTFDVKGLNLVPGARSVGTIQIITDETLDDQTIGAQIGMPRDLDGDGVASNNNVSTTARMLPVVLQLQWVGPSGVTTMTHGFYVLGY